MDKGSFEEVGLVAQKSGHQGQSPSLSCSPSGSFLLAAIRVPDGDFQRGQCQRCQTNGVVYAKAEPRLCQRCVDAILSRYEND